MNGKSMLVLVLAIALGLGAMFLTRRVLNRPAAEEETQEILVATRDVKEEEIVKPEMVKSMRMAKSAVPAGAFSSFKEIEERWVKTALLEGDPVIEKRLGPKGTPPGLVANIPKGMRAFAIEVNEQSGVSGFILPGHRVDVVRFDGNERSQHVRGETILQNVLVLASGQVFTRAEEKAVQSRTVTLAVTPDQVDVLVAAKAKGPLSLALRGVNDHDIVDRPAPKPAPDDETKAQTAKLQRELADLKQALAKKMAEPPKPLPPAPPPPASPKPQPKVEQQRWVHIYRPMHDKRDEDRRRGNYPERIAVNNEARKVAERDRRGRAEEPRGLGFGATPIAGVSAEAEAEPILDQ
jgi:pilus assembly protein CpaB